MSEVVTITEEEVRYEEKHRLLRCPECGEWNRVGYNRPVDKIFVVTCGQCGTKYRPL